MSALDRSDFWGMRTAKPTVSASCKVHYQFDPDLYMEGFAEKDVFLCK